MPSTEHDSELARRHLDVLAVVAEAERGTFGGVSAQVVARRYFESGIFDGRSIAQQLKLLERGGLVEIDAGSFYSVTPAGRAALPRQRLSSEDER